MYARDVMIPHNNILHCLPDTTVAFASGLLLSTRVGSILITKEDTYFGFVTKHDLLEAYHLGKDTQKTTVQEIMKSNRELHYVKENETLDRCADLMITKGCHHLLVKNMMNRVVGLISSIDIVKAISGQVKVPFTFSLSSLFAIGK